MGKWCLADGFFITAKEGFFAPLAIGETACFPSVTSWDFPKCWGNPVKLSLFDAWVYRSAAQDSQDLENEIIH